MIRLSINGKDMGREFQNMAQALAFAYQNGECYGAKCVELSDGVSKTGKGGGFTQADIDTAVEKSVKDVREKYETELEAYFKKLTAQQADIDELKKQLEAKDATTDQNTEQVNPATEVKTNEEVNVENTPQA